MPTVRTILIAGLGLVLFACGQGEPKPETLEDLVQQLDAEAFTDRVAAQKRLTQLAEENPDIAERLGEWTPDPKRPEQEMRLHQIIKALPLRLSFSEAQIEKFGLTPSADGVKGGAARFDGKTHEVLLKDSKLPAGPFTLQLWFRSKEDKLAQYIVADYEPCSYKKEGLNLVLYGSEYSLGPCLGLVVQGKNHADMKGDFLDGKWHHVAIVCGEEQTEVVVDGTSRKVIPLAYARSALSLKLGNTESHCNQRGNYRFHGDMDELSVVRRTLSAAAIKGIFEAGSKEP